MSDNAFDLARRVPVASIAGVALRKAGRDLFGPCPRCGGEPGSQRFHVTPAANTWFCFGCRDGGGPIELACLMRTGRTAKTVEFETLLGIARELATMPAPPAPPKAQAKPAQPATSGGRAQTALTIWRDAKPATGTLVEAWLAARGIDVQLYPETLARLRFHPRALAAAGKYEHGPRKGNWWRVEAPAMVAALLDENGRVGGVHCTYLAADGRAKALMVTPDGEAVAARKMWGQALGLVAQLTALRGRPGPLIVGEGIETTLSACAPWAAAGAAYRAAAVLTLGNLQGGYVRDADGMAFRPPLADPHARPWTLKDAGDVVLLIDRDMSAVKLKQRGMFGASDLSELAEDERAAFCAALASQHWRAAGAAAVYTIQPRQRGQDFNDALSASRKAHQHA